MGPSRLGHWLSGLFTVVTLAYLGHQLSTIGWAKVLGALPRQPLYYLLFLAVYLTLPVSEMVVFRLLLGVPAAAGLRLAILRRIYSSILLDYSGEAYTYVWARRATSLSSRTLVRVLRDNIVLSSASSVLFALAALAGLILSGSTPWPSESPVFAAPVYDGPVPIGAIVALAGLTIAVVPAWALARSRVRPAIRTPARIGVVHLSRQVVLALLQTAVWVTVDPTVPLSSWLSLLGAHIVVTRIPFLPGRDVVFASAGLSLAGQLGIPPQTIGGATLVAAALDRGLSAFLYGALALSQRLPQGLTPPTLSPELTTP